MDGKVVVVTGASGALGKVVAEAALARGARVAGVDHAPTQVPPTENRIELGGVDLSDPAQAKNAIDAIAALFGRLDVLINIAGGFAFEAIAEGETRTWQRMYALNVLTALNASRSALPYIAASPAGRMPGVTRTMRWPTTERRLAASAAEHTKPSMPMSRACAARSETSSETVKS